MEEDVKRQKIREWLEFFVLLALVLIIKIYVVAPVSVDGESMNPTLLDGDYMILNRIIYKFEDIKRGDIVVLDYKNSKLVKRVIGLPGDNVSAEKGILYINGKAYDEPYLDDKVHLDDFKFSDITGKNKLSKGEYFVLGDNRPYSLDSRRIGIIKKSDIEGKVRLTLFPFSRIGIKK